MLLFKLIDKLFSNKARCVLLDSPKIIYRFPRTGSDEEFLRKISAIRAKYKYRSDSARDSAREDPSNQSSPSVNISKTYGKYIPYREFVGMAFHINNYNC